MEIYWFDTLPSTQIYLKDGLKNGSLQPPVLICTTNQTSGIGSRDNSWSGMDGNLAFSFATSTLPSDLPLQSSSIYFAYIFKHLLCSLGSTIWVKWPNDLYIGKKKCGGVITQVVGENIICGIGLNIVAPDTQFGKLDIQIDVGSLIEMFVALIDLTPSWSGIFSQFRLEFDLSRNYFVHINGSLKSLKEAELMRDGSIVVDGERVYSSR